VNYARRRDQHHWLNCPLLCADQALQSPTLTGSMTLRLTSQYHAAALRRSEHSNFVHFVRAALGDCWCSEQCRLDVGCEA